MAIVLMPYFIRIRCLHFIVNDFLVFENNFEAFFSFKYYIIYHRTYKQRFNIFPTPFVDILSQDILCIKRFMSTWSERKEKKYLLLRDNFREKNRKKDMKF